MTHEKILSARLMKSIPMYIEKNYGASAASEYLKRAGVSHEQLNDSDLWFSWEQYLAMLGELVRITGDESSAYEAGRYVSAPGILKEAWHLLFTGLVNVKTAFKALIPVGRMYNRSADWEILDITGTSVRLRINWKEGIRTNRASCLNRQGMLASIPTMFGMPEARSSELQCQADGHDSCVEEYTWRNPRRRMFTLYFSTMGVVVAATTVHLFSANLPLAASIALIAFLAGFVVDDAVIMKAKSALYTDQNAQMARLVKRLEDRYEELKKTAEQKQNMERELFKAKQLESLGILAGGIAHDFGNILGTTLTHVSMAKLNFNAPDAASRHIEAAENGFMRAKRLIQQMLTFSQGGAPVKEAVSLAEVIRDSADFALRGTSVKSEYSMPDDLWAVNADDGQISQVISNIVINASQAMPDGGVIGIRAENLHSGAEDYVRISIEDNGIGIAPENLEKIFDPFFTTKSNGSGLGLAIADSIIKKHDGRITVESSPGKTAFHIRLPALKDGSPANTDMKDTGVIYKGNGRILVMDDDKDFSDAICEGLTGLGYTADAASDGVEAIDKYRKARVAGTGNGYAVVILDLTNHGGVGGKETMRRLKEIAPDVIGIISSGYSNDPVMSKYGEYGFKTMLVKPYTIQKLSETLHELLQVESAGSI